LLWFYALQGFNGGIGKGIYPFNELIADFHDRGPYLILPVLHDVHTLGILSDGLLWFGFDAVELLQVFLEAIVNKMQVHLLKQALVAFELLLLVWIEHGDLVVLLASHIFDERLLQVHPFNHLGNQVWHLGRRLLWLFGVLFYGLVLLTLFRATRFRRPRMFDILGDLLWGLSIIGRYWHLLFLMLLSL